MGNNAVYLTDEGLQKLRAEVEQLQTIERPKISKQIAEARDKGDLSENAEYDAAKEAQGLLEAKIAKLQDMIANARIIDKSKLDNSKVQILSSVTIKNSKNKAEKTYTIVTENEADIKSGKISVTSPIAKGLIGRKLGEKVQIKVPNGLMEFEITGIN